MGQGTLGGFSQQPDPRYPAAFPVRWYLVPCSYRGQSSPEQDGRLETSGPDLLFRAQARLTNSSGFAPGAPDFNIESLASWELPES